MWVGVGVGVGVVCVCVCVCGCGEGVTDFLDDTSNSYNTTAPVLAMKLQKKTASVASKQQKQ